METPARRAYLRKTVKADLKRSLARYPAWYARARRGADLARWAARRPHERDFEFYRYAAVREGVFLDVGAHTGTSVLSFRTYNRLMPIVSIEPNGMLRRDLELLARLVRGFRFELIAAGAERSEMTLYVPCYRGTPLSGEASLLRKRPEDVWWIHQNVRRLRPGEYTLLEQRVRVVPLDDLALVPAHVKIDVEGCELDVLRGMRHTLEEHRPTILLERTADFGRVSSWLHGHGYEPMTWRHSSRELVPLDDGMQSQNVFFVAGRRRESPWNGLRDADVTRPPTLRFPRMRG